MKRLATTAAVVAMLVAVVISATLVIDIWRQRLYAKETAGRMRRLSALLQAHQITEVGQSRLIDLTSSAGTTEDLRDRWGNDLHVEVRRDEDGKLHYLIRSFAADGEPSTCCGGFVERNKDLDLVLYDDKWLQIWN